MTGDRYQQIIKVNEMTGFIELFKSPGYTPGCTWIADENPIIVPDGPEPDKKGYLELTFQTRYPVYLPDCKYQSKPNTLSADFLVEEQSWKCPLLFGYQLQILHYRCSKNLPTFQ